MRRRRAGRAAAVAVLHATTSSFTDRAISSSAISTQKRSSSPGERSPYGKRAVSPRYTKSSWGSETSSSWSTVSPPTPESKTAIGRSRGSAAGTSPIVGSRPAATRGRRCDAGLSSIAAARSSARARLLLLRVADRVDRVLQLAHDRRAQVGARLGLEGDDRGHDAGDEQDQPDVLDGALTVVARDEGAVGLAELVVGGRVCETQGA